MNHSEHLLLRVYNKSVTDDEIRLSMIATFQYCTKNDFRCNEIRSQMC
jgi:hypothetical protein